MSYSFIRYSVEDGIATILLSRPDKLNALNSEMRNEIIAAIDEVDADDAVRAVIFTGEGRAYCAGADLGGGQKTFQNLVSGDPEWNDPALRDGGGMMTLRLFNCLKPVIGAINGAAVGIGATMLLPMDVRIASEDAKFGFVFARRGLVPEAASSWFLPRVVGISRALDWCYSGRLVSAAEAQTGGLVQSVHEPDDLLAAARSIAASYAENSAPVSVALTRQMLWRMLGADHPMEAHKIDSRCVFSRGRSDDVREGVSAFLEKRTADFPNAVSKDMPGFYPWWEEPQYG